MPFVRIAVRQGKPAPYRRAIADAVHAAMVEVAPEDWSFGNGKAQYVKENP
jgi:4-oxalocrotonate tautomerase